MCTGIFELEIYKMLKVLRQSKLVTSSPHGGGEREDKGVCIESLIFKRKLYAQI